MKAPKDQQTNPLPSYGGQAIIEGVMMRGTHVVAMAMRAPNKEIIVQTEKLSSIYRSRITKIPFLRGLVILWDVLNLGFRALTLSANLQGEEEDKIEGPAMYLTFIFSLLLAIGLFFLIPAAIAHATEWWLGWNAYWGNLVEGLMRLLLLIGYIWAIGRIPDIQRVFAYHGAEHKTINAFEAGEELHPQNVTNYPVEHPRCGTAFLLALVLLSVVVFSILGPLSWEWRLLSRLLMIPIIAGIAYEYIRWTANHLNSPLVGLLIRPNLALQRLTTREPSLDMLEVSIAAFNAMREEEAKQTVL
ncbi:MAG: DUF1385 domain-containing protein [Chloroflexota bacterium]